MHASGRGQLPDHVDLARWPTGQLPSGMCDSVIVTLPKPLSGFGTSRQLDCLADGLNDRGIAFSYVGSPLTEGPSAMTDPLVAVPPTNTYAETYSANTSAMRTAFEALAAQGSRHPLVIAMGYTSFGPAAARAAWRAVPSVESTSIVMVDSALPDGLSDDVDETGPASRFYRPEYRSEPGFATYFAITSAYDYEPRILIDWVPPVAAIKVVAPPYSQSYIESLEAAGHRARDEGLAAVPSLGALDDLADRDLLIPLLSSDIWSPSAVGVWMTQPQYETVVRGTEAVLAAVEAVAQERHCRIAVPMDASLLNAMPDIEESLTGSSSEVGAYLVPYENLPQAEHAAMIALADLVIGRTGGQANAFAVAALVGTTTLVVDMPALDYMHAVLSSAPVTIDVRVSATGAVNITPAARPLGYRASWDDAPEVIAATINGALSDPADRAARADNARSAFLALRQGSGDLFSIIQQSLHAP